MKPKILPVIICAALSGFALKGNAQANQSLSNLTSPTSVNRSLLPGTAHSKNLGSSSNQWQYLYLYGRIYLNGILTMHAHGTDNIFIGGYAGNTSVTGDSNTGTGQYALTSISNGAGNTASGAYSLYSNTSGYDNTAAGYSALYSNVTGTYNTATGIYALGLNKADNNTADGAYALYTNTTGTGNTALGSAADVSNGALTNATVIGYNAIVDASNKVRIGNTAVTSIGGQVGWTVFSDGRYKKNIETNVPGLAFINNLRPVTYTVDIKALDEYYSAGRKQLPGADSEEIKQDDAENTAGKIVYTGLIAQETEAAAQKIGFDFSGVDMPKTKDGLYGLRYDNFVPPLVKAVQELSGQNASKDSAIKEWQTANAAMQKEIDELKSMIQSRPNSDDSFAQDDIVLTNASLGQNIPNPFKNTTTIDYTLPQKFSSAQIIITDNGGNILKEINLPASRRGSVNIHASSFAAGTYNYSLLIDGKVTAKQMMLVK